MTTDVKVQVFPHFINGQWTPSTSGEFFEVKNPATAEVVAQVAKGNAEDVDRAVQNAKEVYESGVWSKKSQAERAQIMMQFAGKIKDNAQQIIYLEGISTGATLRKLGGRPGS